MQKIYTGIDLGSDSIKMLTGEFISDEFHVLANVLIPSCGIHKGLVSDEEQLSGALLKAKQKTEDMLGIPINKAIIAIPSDECVMTISSGKIAISNEENEITGEEIRKVLADAVLGQVSQELELVNVSPINFVVDGNNPVRDPKGLKGESLEVKAVLASVSKEIIHPFYEVMKLCGIEVSDICFNMVGDYFEGKTIKTEQEVGAIINIGGDTTTVSIFNKGIMIKSKVLKVGGRFIDNDIRYVYETDMKTSKELKEGFSFCSKSDDQVDEEKVVTSKTSDLVKIKQSKISEIVASRITDILKNAKNEINLLTNREIRYIMIAGGISELKGFEQLAKIILGEKATVIKIKTIGIRNNQYASVLGILKYFNWKLELRDQSYAMFQDKSVKELTCPKKKENDNVVNKVFGHFFEN